ncbi:hypothetical protein HUE56_24025 (plasmid) [Azospirillum oryzae]|uniref:Uncharacterized protein n=1 Tax=Azospirillum oryzae TaxID=286727 RepID=A0A6N1APD0_9PROT|nr:hypothetical protein [Azospirillum oryzae]KAA0586371.1 hypothetical protein FZ938_22095 [Azospirillum oryzae]QKS53566.1 hypothetical protein HUE56_24025 [Azospirillum oryzae]
MIVLSLSQQAALQRSAMVVALRDIGRELSVLYPETAPADIERTTRAALDKADVYGFESCGAVLCLASLILEFGPDFDRISSEPCLQRALFDRNASETYRIEELMRHAIKCGRRVTSVPDVTAFAALN